MLEQVGLFPEWLAFQLICREQLIIATHLPRGPRKHGFRHPQGLSSDPSEDLCPLSTKLGHNNRRSLSPRFGLRGFLGAFQNISRAQVPTGLARCVVLVVTAPPPPHSGFPTSPAGLFVVGRTRKVIRGNEPNSVLAESDSRCSCSFFYGCAEF